MSDHERSAAEGSEPATAGPAPGTDPFDVVGSEIASLLRKTHEVSARTRQEAEEQAKALVGQAEVQAQARVAEADVQAQARVAEADARAQARLSDAETRAQTRVDEAETLARTRLDEVERQVQALLVETNTLVQKRLADADAQVARRSAEADRHLEATAQREETAAALLHRATNRLAQLEQSVAVLASDGRAAVDELDAVHTALATLADAPRLTGSAAIVDEAASGIDEGTEPGPAGGAPSAESVPTDDEAVIDLRDGAPAPTATDGPGATGPEGATETTGGPDASETAGAAPPEPVTTKSKRKHKRRRLG